MMWLVMIRMGRKTREWQIAKKMLTKKYLRLGIIRCELCGSEWMLSFHHLDKRSSQLAEHTVEGTRLLCAKCHERAEYDKETNERLKLMRRNIS